MIGSDDRGHKSTSSDPSITESLSSDLGEDVRPLRGSDEVSQVLDDVEVLVLLLCSGLRQFLLCGLLVFRVCSSVVSFLLVEIIEFSHALNKREDQGPEPEERAIFGELLGVSGKELDGA